MNNSVYQLNIDDKYVKLYSEYLGYGNPDSEFWFIGNEQALAKIDGIIESPLKKIKNDSLDDSNSYEYRSNNTNFFTQKTNCINANYDWFYLPMEEMTKLDKKDLFIIDLFFLPSEKGEMLGITYGNEKLGRKEFYENNKELFKLLENRIKYLFSLLEENGEKQVYIYSYGYVKENFNLIKNILELGKIENWINDNHCIFFYKGNHITIKNLIK